VSKLKAELAAAQDAAIEQRSNVPDEVRADGFAIAVEAWSDEPGYALALKSLDADGARLLSVVPETDQSPERATVWLPYRAVERFFAKIDGFAYGQTPTGNPRNRDLVANIAELRLAVLRYLPIRYALLVSLHTDAVGTDIYPPIATQIGIPIEIMT
jgi:hypothetical protein